VSELWLRLTGLLMGSLCLLLLPPAVLRVPLSRVLTAPLLEYPTRLSVLSSGALAQMPWASSSTSHSNSGTFKCRDLICRLPLLLLLLAEEQVALLSVLQDSLNSE
jgi:hypothetical protein